MSHLSNAVAHAAMNHQEEPSVVAAGALDSGEVLVSEERYVVGQEIFDYTIFQFLLRDIRRRPPGYLQVIRDAVCSAKILKEVMGKIDTRLLDGKLVQVDIGFRYLVGYLWEVTGDDMEWTASWITDLFAPIIAVATAAFDVGKPKEGKRDEDKAKLAAQFMKNLRKIQETEPVASASSRESSQSACSDPGTTSHRIVHVEGPMDEPEAIFEEQSPGKLPGIFESWRLLHVDRDHEWDTIDPEMLKAASSWPLHSQVEESGVPPVAEPAATNVTLVVGTTTSITVAELDYENVFESFLRDDDDLYLPADSDSLDDGASEDDGALKVSGALVPPPTTPKKSSKGPELRSPLAPLNV
ncbi:hypothetical protein MVEN_00971200 [Mycena venus]|uniref:Uncharacterized protein n=1 Tax=Mycena venus TaxID=2733690 RepID=A0A8H6YCU1_9AGAR|nr:hypothetical protein MVEN_00971200 [Mycena venus]